MKKNLHQKNGSTISAGRSYFDHIKLMNSVRSNASNFSLDENKDENKYNVKCDKIHIKNVEVKE